MCLKKPLITEYKKLYAFENLTDVKSIHIKYDAGKGQYTIEDESADKNKLKTVAKMFNLVRLYCEMISIEKRKYNEIKELNENLGVFRDKSKKILLSEDVEINDDVSLQQEENKSNKESASKIIEPIIKAVAITEKIYNLITILLKEKQRGEEVAAIDILKETSWQVNKTQDDNLKKEIGTELDKLFKKYNDKGCKGLAEIVLTSYLPFVKIYRVCQKITNLSDYQEDLRQKNFCFEEEEVSKLEEYCKNNKKNSIRNGDLLDNDSSKLKKLGQKIDVIFKAEKLAYKNENDAEFIKTISNYTQASEELVDNREAIATIANTSLSKRRRKYKSIISAIIIILIIGTACVNICKPLIKYQHMAMSLSYSTESGEFEFRKYDNSGAEIISAEPLSEDGTVEFPSQVALDNEGWFDKDVVAIGANVFGEESEKNFTAVFIPKSITHIDSNAFDGCENITILCEIAERPDGYEAGWSGKNTVIWSWQSGVEFSTVVIDGMNFILQKDTAILKGLEGAGKESLEIPSEITVGGKDYKVTQIAEKALEAENDSEKFAQISSITVPDSVTSIGQTAFGGCSNLTSITLPFVGAELNGTTNTHFGYIFGAEEYGYNRRDVPAYLETVIIENNRADANISIGANSFYGCAKLKNITFGDAVTMFASSALVGCSEIKTLTLPFLGKTSEEGSNLGYLFANGSNTKVPGSLQSVTITGEYPIVADAFKECDNLKEISLNAATFIGDEAFAGCDKLKTVNVSNDIKGIGNNVFLNCGNLDYNNEPNGANYIGNEGRPYLILVNSKNVSQLTINEDTRIIANNAFEGCTELSGITIPKNVIMIGDNAFAGCTEITEMVIPDNVQSIGLGAFAGCNGMAKITIPFVGAELNETTNSHFGYIFGASSYSGNSSYFPSSLKEVVVNGGTTIGDYAFAECNRLNRILVSDKVENIGQYTFSGCSELSYIDIGKSIDSIGKYAFYDCYGLKEVHINDLAAWCEIEFEFNELNSDPFANPLYYSKSLYLNDTLITDLRIPDGVTNISNFAFYNCESFQSIYISDSVINIGDYAFYSCDGGLTSLIIGKNVLNIGDYAFGYCRLAYYGLPSPSYNTYNVVIPTSVASIGLGAFVGYNSAKITIPFAGATVDGAKNTFLGHIFGAETYLQDSKIPASLKEVEITGTNIGHHAFYNCQNLTSIYISDSVTEIGGYAFSGCSAEIVWGENPKIKSIGSWSFSNYSGAELIIPNDVNTIEFSAISDCSSETIILSNSVTTIEDQAFWKCSNLTSLVIGDVSQLEFIGESAFCGCEKLASILLPDNLKTLEPLAFADCVNLISIIIPCGVTSIGQQVFYGCNGLKNIVVDEENSTYYSINNCIIETATKTLIAGCSNSVIPIDGSVTSIGGGVFSGYQGIESVFIPDSVTSIGDGAFSGSSIASINIPASVTSIGAGTFFGCRNLTHVTIPNSITNIKDITFHSCSSLTEIILPASVTSIGDDVFWGCENLTIFCAVESQPSGWSDDWNSGCEVVWDFKYEYEVRNNAVYITKYNGTETDIILPSKIEGFPVVDFGTTFKETDITSIVISDSVLSIEGDAFSGCSGLTSITIPDSVTSIGRNAFDNCSKLTSITIPNSVMFIGWGALLNCNSLERLSIPFIGEDEEMPDPNICFIFGSDPFGRVPNSLKEVVITREIDIDGFYNCRGITRVIIKSNARSIEEGAFMGCEELENVVLPNSITSIGESAFSGCYSLQNITIPITVSNIGSYAFAYCRELESIAVPNSVVSIGLGVFRGCNELEKINIPFVGAELNETQNTHFGYIFGAGVNSENHYYVPSSLKEVVLTGGNDIDDWAFYGCASLESVFIPNSIKSIGMWAFLECSSLTSITIPDSVTSIGTDAFVNCTSLSNIVVSNNVTSIPHALFYGCSQLKSLTIPFVGATLNGVENSHFGYLFGADNSVDNEMYVPNSLKQVVITGGANIGSEAFYYCSSLTSIIIPHSVTNIGSEAFTGCSGLISITIPNSVTSIGEYAFYGCNLIYCEAITKPTGWHDNWIGGRGCPVVWDCNNNDRDANGNIYYISDAGIIYALNNSCASVIMGQSGALSGSLIVYEKLIYKDVKYTVTYINESAFTACVYLDEVVIGDGIISIGRYAFYNCFRMTSILIGNNVKSIGDWAFAYCSNLESIKFEGTMEQWQAISKGSFWMSDTGDFTIICTDGELDKNGRQIR